MKFKALLAIASVVLTCGVARADERLGEAEYITGHAGHTKQIRGMLAIRGSDVQLLVDVNRDTVYHGAAKKVEYAVAFAIPLADVKAAMASTERENYFGVISANAVRNQDYVTIKTESKDTAEAVVFKVGKKQAEGIASKIEFAARKLRESQ